jgi:hypothetical protein
VDDKHLKNEGFFREIATTLRLVALKRRKKYLQA